MISGRICHAPCGRQEEILITPNRGFAVGVSEHKWGGAARLQSASMLVVGAAGEATEVAHEGAELAACIGWRTAG